MQFCTFKKTEKQKRRRNCIKRNFGHHSSSSSSSNSTQSHINTNTLGPIKLRGLQKLLSRRRKTAAAAPTTTTTTTTTATTTRKARQRNSATAATQQQQQQQQEQASSNGQIGENMKNKEKAEKAEKADNAPSPPPEKVLYDTRIKRKNVLALNEKVAAIREYEKMPVYKRIGRMFHCSPDQIKRIVQQKDAILKAWEQRTRRCQDAKTLELKVVRVSMLGKAVYDWIRRMMYYKDFMITDGLIQKMALQFKSAMGLQNFFPHQDWCDKFRQTYKISEHDSKLLKIGYTQGYSVQIKDVMKDVLSECTPDVVSRGATDDSIDAGEDSDESENRHTPAKRAKTKATAKRTPETTLRTTLPQLQPFRQLVALPIQTNGSNGVASVGGGMTQKVLVATPITAGGQRSSTQPMTMTIIPLATIAQTQQQNAKGTGERQSVPPPMPVIKQEIKEEPIDFEIKQEYISDDETPEESDNMPDITDLTEKYDCEADGNSNDEEGNTDANAKTADSRKIQNTVMTVIAADAIIDDENLALSRLRRIIQTQNSETATSTPPPPLASTPTAVFTEKSSTAAAATTLPLPPLTRAPTAALNRLTHKRKHNADTTAALPAITSCSEARKYLKLLEDFALFRENFRLIGLITRADEVLRELDGDDDIDVD